MRYAVNVINVVDRYRQSANLTPCEELFDYDNFKIKMSAMDLNELLPTFECPVCCDFLQPPIYMCNSGHNVCCECTNKLNPKICPLCLCPMGTLRNLSLEHIVKKFILKCKNAEFGCKFIGNKITLREHKSSCLFNQYICPLKKAYNTCAYNWRGPFQHFLPHFKIAHSTTLIVEVGELFYFDRHVIDKDNEGLVLLTTFSDLLFILHFKFSPSEGLAYWTVQKMDGYYSVPEFKYTIEISGVESNIWIAFPCTSSLKSFKNKFTSNSCAVLPLPLIKNLLNDHGKLPFRVHIHKNSNINANQETD